MITTVRKGHYLLLWGGASVHCCRAPSIALCAAGAGFRFRRERLVQPFGCSEYLPRVLYRFERALDKLLYVRLEPQRRGNLRLAVRNGLAFEHGTKTLAQRCPFPIRPKSPEAHRLWERGPILESNRSEIFARPCPS